MTKHTAFFETARLHFADGSTRLGMESLHGTYHFMPRADTHNPGDSPDLSTCRSVTLLPRIALSAGTPLMFECQARAATGATGADAGQSGLTLRIRTLRRSDSQAEEVFRHILLAGPQWERFQVPLETGMNLEPNQWELVFEPAHFGGRIEMREPRLSVVQKSCAKRPSAQYRGQEPRAPWRERAREMIARHRMSDLIVEVTDRLGRPLSGARVQVCQQRHAYPFGTCVQAARIVDAEVSFADKEMTRECFLADNARYRSELERLFNCVVTENDLKWPRWDESHPNFRQCETLRALQWLHERGFSIKGHTLMWASWKMSPAWLRELEGNTDALQRAILAHIRDVASATAPFTSAWDVLNEPMSHRELIELLGHEAVAAWFRAARECLPGQKLLLNEFDLVGNGGSPDRRRGIYKLIDDLRRHDGAPDALGCQAHFWSDRLTAPESIWEILDEISDRTGLPVHTTEFDINFPNDALQSDYTRDFLTAWFAHPATESFIMWGFWGGAHWYGERGAMLRRNWTPKPNLEAYTSLVFREWWTNETLSTDECGRARTKVFHGRHVLTISAADKTVARVVEVGAEGAALRIVVPGVTDGA